jgi:hypothetical protein
MSLTMGLLLLLILLIIAIVNLLLLDPMLLKGLSEYPTNKPLLKFCFLDIDKKKMENVNQGGRKASKYLNFVFAFYFSCLQNFEYLLNFCLCCLQTQFRGPTTLLVVAATPLDHCFILRIFLESF